MLSKEDSQERDQAEKLLDVYKKDLAKRIARAGIPYSYFGLWKPHNLLILFDSRQIYYVLGFNNAARGMSTTYFRNFSSKGQLKFDDVILFAEQTYGFTDRLAFSFSRSFLTYNGSELTAKLSRFVEENFKREYAFLTKPRAVEGFSGLQKYLDKLLDDHPDFEKNVFIMIRIRDKEEDKSHEYYKYYKETNDAIHKSLNKYGLNGLRADQKVYPEDDDLWNNVCVYMMGCKYGISVLEDFDKNTPNYNVPLEYGFMRACNKRVLLLKEKNMGAYPSDIIGKLYKEFDKGAIENTISQQIDEWVNDIGLK